MTASATATPETTTRSRYKWSADEKAALVREIEAAKGDPTARQKVLDKFSKVTGAQPQSVQATYYAIKAKGGNAVGQPRGARKPASGGNTILDAVNALVARKAEIETALDPKARKAMERELKVIERKLGVFTA